jgi:NTP pyrophosphatase (non-canonical NTP hydrolase)
MAGTVDAMTDPQTEPLGDVFATIDAPPAPLAERIVEWHDREWFDVHTGRPKTVEQVASKLAEETGEVIGAVIKLTEGRADSDWLAEARKELGDLLVVATVLADRLSDVDVDGRDWDLDAVLAERFASVQHRRSADYR